MATTLSHGDQQTLRRLTDTHPPDPQAWLLAADLLAENGYDEEARRWRRYSGRFATVCAAIVLAASEAIEQDETLLFDGFRVSFFPEARFVAVFIDRQHRFSPEPRRHRAMPSILPVWASTGRYIDRTIARNPERADYVTRKALEILARLHEMEEGREPDGIDSRGA
jgi:hypothetical protein